MRNFVLYLCMITWLVLSTDGCNSYVGTHPIDLEAWSSRLFQSNCSLQKDISFCRFGIDSVDIDDDDVFVRNEEENWYNTPRLYYNTNLWRWGKGKVALPKTDIVNVALYFNATTNTYHFLMDTLSNGTDLSVGVWFLQNEVDLNDNKFGPRHANGDLVYSLRNHLTGFLMTQAYKWNWYLSGGPVPNIYTNCDRLDLPLLWFPFNTTYYNPTQLFYGYFQPPVDFVVKTVLFWTAKTRYDYFTPLSDFHVLNL